jgi:hypothetical protein
MEDILNTEGMAEKLEARSKETQVYTVEDAQVSIMKSDPPQISVTAEGTVRTTGWSNGRLKPHIYVQPPPDGIYGFEFLATPPEGESGDAITPITSEEYKAEMPEGFKGVRIHAETNEKEFFPTEQDDDK